MKTTQSTTTLCATVWHCSKKVYSKSNNAVFVFAVNCFQMLNYRSLRVIITTGGIFLWLCLVDVTDLSSYLIFYENRQKLSELTKKLCNCRNTIDAETQQTLNSETRHWKYLIERLIAVFEFLVQCLPWRSQLEKPFVHNNVNVLKLIELFGKSDLVSGENVRQTNIGENKRHH